MFDQLETERLLLRRFQPSDAADCFDFLSDRETCRLDGGYEPFPEMNGDFRSLMDKWQENDDSRRMIVLKSENKVVGTLHFMPDRRRCVQTRELGFVLSPNYRRRGYMREALEAVIEYFFRETEVRMVTCGTVGENVPCISLLKKLGFQPEGRLHNAFVLPDAGLVDLEYYYLDRA